MVGHVYKQDSGNLFQLSDADTKLSLSRHIYKLEKSSAKIKKERLKMNIKL